MWNRQMQFNVVNHQSKDETWNEVLAATFESSVSDTMKTMGGLRTVNHALYTRLVKDGSGSKGDCDATLLTLYLRGSGKVRWNLSAQSEESEANTFLVMFFMKTFTVPSWGRLNRGKGRDLPSNHLSMWEMSRSSAAERCTCWSSFSSFLPNMVEEGPHSKALGAPLLPQSLVVFFIPPKE